MEIQMTSIRGFRRYTTYLSRTEDKDAYYLVGFTKCDSEVAHMIGSKMHYSREEADAYFVSCLNDSTRYDFLIFDPQGSLIGGSVIDEISEQIRSANFKVCILESKNCGRGIGNWATRTARDFAFCERKLHRLSLDVFSSNIRARRACERAGFRVEGILRDVIWDNGVRADDILMSALEEEWKQIA